LKRREFERVRIKAALEEFKGGSAIAVVGFAAKLSFHPFKASTANEKQKNSALANACENYVKFKSAGRARLGRSWA
jgi:hypothetical protein